MTQEDRLNRLLIIKRLRQGLNPYGAEGISDKEKKARDILVDKWSPLSDEQVMQLLESECDALSHMSTTAAIIAVSARDEEVAASCREQVVQEQAHDAYREIACEGMTMDEGQGDTYQGADVADAADGPMLFGNTLDPEIRAKMTGGRSVGDGLEGGEQSAGAAADLTNANSANDTQIAGRHYQQDRVGSNVPVQHWDFVWMHKIPYHEAQVIRYIMRHDRKNGAEDVRKAIHFCQKILELYYGEGM